MLMIPFYLIAQETSEVNSRITDITVFLRGAQVTRLAPVQVKKGTAVFAFKELPVNLDAGSIQVRGEGNFTILSTTHQINYLGTRKQSEQLKMLQDSLGFYENLLDNVNAMLSVNRNEEELLIANRELGGNDKGVLITELKVAVDYYRARFTEIKKEAVRLTNEKEKYDEQLKRIKDQINAINAGSDKITSEILVTISSSDNANGSLILSYIVYQASWTPVYDIRVKDVSNPVQLFYNAQVLQNTGEDWEKVNLKLSTADPQQRGVKPVLESWYIDFEQPEPFLMKSARQITYMAPVLAEEEAVNDVAFEPEKESLSTASYTTVAENQTNLEFIISLPYDIPSDNKQHAIRIQENSLPATFEYYVVPKLDNEAFLVAHVTGWEDFNLLSGEINLFFEGTFVGKSMLYKESTGDTLDLSLGRDKGIIVNRVRVKDFTEERTIGNNIRETRSWDISVRNTKKQAVDLRIEDQLPVSMNKDITVTPVDLSGGIYQKESGKVTWKFNLNSSDERKLKFAFEVRYPKDQRVLIE